MPAVLGGRSDSTRDARRSWQTCTQCDRTRIRVNDSRASTIRFMLDGWKTKFGCGARSAMRSSCSSSTPIRAEASCRTVTCAATRGRSPCRATRTASLTSMSIAATKQRLSSDSFASSQPQEHISSEVETDVMSSLVRCQVRAKPRYVEGRRRERPHIVMVASLRSACYVTPIS